MNLNKVLFAGNLTADPELIHTPKGTAVVNASLAVNEFYNSEGVSGSRSLPSST